MAERPDLQKLVDLVERLRAPDGCPWDREQSLPDVRAYLLEEAHELAGAIDGLGGNQNGGDGDWSELAEELGDLLFQVAFIGRLAEEAGAFRLSQVVDGVHRKMVERHPHVFGDEVLADAEAVRQAWERRKLQKEPKRESLFSGVPASLPALLGAYRLTQKAAGVGFDWPDAGPVLDKVEEEIAEVRQALATGRKGGSARGGRRPPVHPRQPRPQARRRPRGRPRRHQPQVPPPLREDRRGAGRPGQDRRRSDAGGDGRVVGGGEGA